MLAAMFVILVSCVFVASIVLMAFRRRARLFEAMTGTPAPNVEGTLSVPEAARILGINIVEMIDLIARRKIPAWRDERASGFVVSRQAVYERVQEQSEHGAVRRAFRKVWRVVKWLP